MEGRYISEPQVGAALVFPPSRDLAVSNYRDQAFVLQWGSTPLEILHGFLARADDPFSGSRKMPHHYAHFEKHIVTHSGSTSTHLEFVVEYFGNAEESTYYYI